MKVTVHFEVKLGPAMVDAMDKLHRQSARLGVPIERGVAKRLHEQQLCTIDRTATLGRGMVRCYPTDKTYLVAREMPRWGLYHSEAPEVHASPVCGELLSGFYLSRRMAEEAQQKNIRSLNYGASAHRVNGRLTHVIWAEATAEPERTA